MNLSSIREWDVGALAQLGDALSARITTSTDVEVQLNDIGRLLGWQGESAGVAREQFQVTIDKLTDEAAALGAVRTLADETHDAVSHLKVELANLDATAAANSMTLNVDGSVDDHGYVDPDAADAGEVRAQRTALRAELTEAAQALIRQATDIDADAAAVLGKAARGEIDDFAAGSLEVATAYGARQGHLTAPTPPENATPLQNSAYWDALDQRQRDEVLARHPDWIGNTDGIPADVRHTANVNRIETERTRLEEIRAEQVAALPERRDSGRFTDNYNQRPYVDLAVTEQKLADLGTLESILNRDENRLDPDDPSRGARLMLLDLESSDSTRAAIAIGDVDNADHISVTTPGVSTTVESLNGMATEAAQLRDEALRQLDQTVGREHETVASIAWLGYDPPSDVIGAVSADSANDGAPRLARFYEGLDVASTRPDPHITALGHSYGSYTQALALQDPEPGQFVDDAVFYGSPGINANDESDLGLREGHGYVMRAPDDPISYIDGIGWYGPDPVTTDLEQLSVLETTVDGERYEDASGHSEYPRFSDPNGPYEGRPRVSGYNMAAIVAGLPGNAIR